MLTSGFARSGVARQKGGKGRKQDVTRVVCVAAAVNFPASEKTSYFCATGKPAEPVNFCWPECNVLLIEE